MRKLIAMVGLACALGALAGCHQTSTSTVSTLGPSLAPGTGAPDAAGAVRDFMAAIERSDMKSLGNIFGSASGPASQSIPKQELEEREAIMMCHLKHDSYDLLADAPAPGGGRKLVLQVSYKGITRSSDVLAVQGPANRWYVQQVDLAALEDICKQR